MQLILDIDYFYGMIVTTIKGLIMTTEDIKKYHNTLVSNGILKKTPNTVWAQHNGNFSNPNYIWKMHLYADGYEDWYNLSRVVIPYLVSQNATFKTVNTDKYSVDRILNDRNCRQYGKAFTIHLNNESEFKKLAIGLNYVLEHANLKTVPNLDKGGHNIAFERALGPSGRIFYRAERDNTGRYIDATDAIKINPSQPYNPYNYPDLFYNLFKQRNNQALPSREIIEKIKQLSLTTRIKNSADNNEPSIYFYPKHEQNYATLEKLFSMSGIKHDVHYSRLMERKVFRVLNRDMPTKTPYIIQNTK